MISTGERPESINARGSVICVPTECTPAGQQVTMNNHLKKYIYYYV